VGQLAGGEGRGRNNLNSDGSLKKAFRSRIAERTILLRFLGIILTVLRLQVSVYNVYVTNQFQTTFALGWGGGGVENPLVEVTVNSKEENSEAFCPNYVQ
jgi:hypothetical protein